MVLFILLALMTGKIRKKLGIVFLSSLSLICFWKKSRYLYRFMISKIGLPLGSKVESPAVFNPKQAVPNLQICRFSLSIFKEFMSWMLQPIPLAPLESCFFYYIMGYPVSSTHNINTNYSITFTVTRAGI